jgi:glycosyltransferase involved in cell wall biosynthesis
MSAKRIHVVAFDVPFPPDYGGVTDVYYRCRALKRAGYSVTLHCYEYGRGRDHAFLEIADRIHYYDRPKRLTDALSPLPFIVRTRSNPALLDALLKDDAPILFEGQHCTFLLDHPKLKDRRKIVRLHNIEWQYYAQLADRTRNAVERVFFRREARKLRRHEAVLKHADVLACISHSDTAYYQRLFGKAVYVPAGLDLDIAETKPWQHAPYLLFHGNLSVNENHEAALWLLGQVPFDPSLVIAGKEPSENLLNRCRSKKVELIANPEKRFLEQLLQSAEAHLLISFQQSGIKLKLLNALMTGKPCIATPQLVEGSGLEEYCTIVHTGEELKAAIGGLRPLTEEEQRERIAGIRKVFSQETLIRLFD